MSKYLKFPQMSAIRSMHTSKEDIRILSDKAAQNILKAIPEFSYKLHKGMMGCIGIIGGSREYTGAPYYAAMAALRLGADLAHVFCCESAGTAIKSYSPDLIVHPILNDSNALEQLEKWLPRFHSVVIGPGLGRDENIQNLTEDILLLLKKTKKPTVIDADGLFVITQKTSILNNFPNVIITPNVVEYKRLTDALKKDSTYEKYDGDDLNYYFPDLTVVHKGGEDKIYNSSQIMYVDTNSIKRCGGQGDILSGAIALFTYWLSYVKDGQISKVPNDFSDRNILACYSACSLTRHLNNITFHDLGRGMQASDMLDIKRTQKAFDLFIKNTSTHIVQE